MRKLALKLPGGFEIAQPTPKGGNGLIGPDLTLAKIVSVAIPVIFSLAGLCVFFLFIYGGFKLLTSMGEEQAKEEAKGTMTHAVVGFLIIFTAYWITKFFGKIFGLDF